MSESNSTIGDELLDEARATIERWAVDINDAGPDFQTLHMFASYLLAIADRALQQRDHLLEALKAIVSNSMFEQRFDHCGFMNATALSDRDLFRKLWANARDAIEKAEGRSDERYMPSGKAVTSAGDLKDEP